ncbi:WXG100 family type VII secretion target [Kitasatospora sp. NPDC088134]|uniref:WXG100 family type VII secretion target n=1 Tax=Kitasatospora sp. NPDC088134 TaxID=3364071 RepID=UPI0037FCD28C
MDLWGDVKNLAGDVVKVGEDIVMAPAEIAHWALGKMFGDADAELNKIAQELAELGKQVDGLGREVSGVLSSMTWHGAAADAFTAHAQGRVRELNTVADELTQLGDAVKQLANVL